MKRWVGRAIAGLIVFIASSNIIQAQEAQKSNEAYAVLPGDVLQISVWKEPELQMEVLVRPDSAFSFPLAGDISTKGLSVVELQEDPVRLARASEESARKSAAAKAGQPKDQAPPTLLPFRMPAFPLCYPRPDKA